MTDRTFYADISKYQTVVDSSYTRRILVFRADNGWSTDIDAAANWTAVQHIPTVRLRMFYTVHIPGESRNVVARVKKLFGTNPPDGAMLDVEPWEGFAGPGDHTTEANWTVGEFADYLGNQQRIAGYCPSFGWDTIWRPPAWLKRITPAYGTHDPGDYGWQYYGGEAKYPSPAGWPRSAAPFGSNVDMNMIPRSIDQILTDFAVTPGKNVDPDALTPAEYKYVGGRLLSQNERIQTLRHDMNGDFAVLGQEQDDLRAELLSLTGELAALQHQLEVLREAGA